MSDKGPENKVAASDATVAYPQIPLKGRLSLQKGGGDFLMVEMPQDLLDQVFEAIKTDDMQKSDYRAHISAMSGDELKNIENIEEVGEDILVYLGKIMSVDPEGWDEMDQVWFIECDVPRLKEIRQKYGLTPLMNGDHEFHITIAVKPKKDEEMQFASKKEAIQHMSDLLHVKIIISKEKNTDKSWNQEV